MDIISQVINNFTSIDTISVLLIGVVAGLVIGSIPGMTSTMAIALLIPITFNMDSTNGLIMLVSVYTAGVYAGSLPGILLNTPGTPSSAATVLDGYPLMMQGEGTKAIGIATIGSVVGGLFSGVVLLFLAPILANISLLFSAPEYFLIAVFGLTIIASLSEGSVIKGLMAGTFGLLLGTVGIDLMTGVPRFTFGSVALEGGISLIPALIGFFSISQVMMLSEEKGGNKKLSEKGVKGNVLPTKNEFSEMVPSLIRSPIIGVLVGMLPGTGGDIGSWMSYNEAKRFSKNKEKFGKGSIEGLTASETGNNATTGGSIVPMVTLGIPGSAATAVLLGGIISAGLTPGHELFTKHGDVVYSMIVGFFIATILMGVIGLLSAKHISKVINVPTGIVAPLIVCFAVVGSYAINNSISDVWIMLVVGIMGYFMRKTGFPVAPIVLGLILGPIAEEGFRQSLSMTSDSIIIYYLSRPISVTLIILTVFSVIVPVYRNFKNKKDTN
ncbi:putative tricarboxylic transport membrane protein [Lentibacillus persicus]|uniref:Putative tricarboxylic transport membrane protein n=1 Tax=Lentibacillus persicus TaxID=640948 RepID=A0A1I1VW43_9BACI|nr:tripartite tricarboxylate transporter permease [Lentibacillus persicus]SFD87326.1 putative tricarboxylic transport membrane protein [Lentibacillus persicus]